jgi:serine/threonine-protein kinase
VGVLSLEHRDAPSAFPPGRVSFLSVLAAQAAIAVENATLYRRLQAQVQALQARNREIQQLNDELRRQIKQRSRSLMETILSRVAPLSVKVNLQIGSLLGDYYRIVRPIGQGGMGAVYEVERTTDSVRLAAKVLSAEPDRQDLGRFIREAQILASLNHPNLIAISDVDVTGEGGLYIVMELVSGTSLREQRERFVDVPWALSVLRQVAEALSVLHSQSIIHRDLKPENVLVLSGVPRARPMVKLVDFGISIVLDDVRGGFDQSVAPMLGELDPTPLVQRRASSGSDRQTERAIAPADGTGDSAASALRATKTAPRVDGRRADPDRDGPVLTQTGAIIGTPFYIAPELYHGSRNAQPPSDVFSMGIIAFEMLVGSMPFASPPVLSGGSGQAMAIPSPLRQRAGLSSGLAELFERCLSMDPAKRPAAQEIAAQLQEA